jgi:hypothetical protein
MARGPRTRDVSEPLASQWAAHPAASTTPVLAELKLSCVCVVPELNTLTPLDPDSRFTMKHSEAEVDIGFTHKRRIQRVRDPLGLKDVQLGQLADESQRLHAQCDDAEE